MKKIIFIIISIIMVVTFCSSIYAENDEVVDKATYYNNFMHRRHYKASAIKTINGGSCVHFVEECFYQEYGIWLDFKDNYTTTIKSITDRTFNIGDKKYKLVANTEPTIGSIMFIDKKDFRKAGYKSSFSHVAFVTNYYTFEGDIIIDVLESSLTDKLSYTERYYYYDCWFATNWYSNNEFPDVIYITPELITE